MCIYLSICFSISNPYEPFSVCRTAARNWTSSIVAGVLRLAGDYSKSKSRYSEGIRGPGDWSSGWRGGAVSEECVCIRISINSSVSRCECVRQTPAETNEYICMGMTVVVVMTPLVFPLESNSLYSGLASNKQKKILVIFVYV